MLKLTLPRKQSRNPYVKIYYVTSESDPSQRHIVVRQYNHYFCDCRDFMLRRLPSMNTFNLCKHADFCRDCEGKVKFGHELYSATKRKIKSRAINK